MPGTSLKKHPRTRGRRHEQAIAHARITNYCDSRKLGCPFSGRGNSYGRHVETCPINNVARLLDGGYEIETFDAFLNALQLEHSKINLEKLKQKIDKSFGSYRALLVKVESARKRLGLRKQRGRKAVGHAVLPVSKPQVVRVGNPAVREIAFRQLENAIASSKDIVSLMPKGPLVENLSQVLGVAESSLKILAVVPARGLKQIAGPVHDEEPVDE